MGAGLSRRLFRHSHDIEGGNYPGAQQASSISLSGFGGLGALPEQTEAPEVQATCTIRSVLNLKKQTLKILPDEDNPGQFHLSFVVDTVRPCSAAVYLMAHEKESKSGGPPRVKSKHSKTAVACSEFGMGLEQKYKMPPGTNIPLSSYQPEELSGPKGSRFPLVIRLETLPLVNGLDRGTGNLQAQTTYCTVNRQPDGSYEAHVVKQVLWVDSRSYVLHEIFGIDRNADDDKASPEDSHKECVICLAETRDTLALPCRHLCMCSDCAKALRYQTNKCPICRCVVESLLQIKVIPHGNLAQASGKLLGDKRVDGAPPHFGPTTDTNNITSNGSSNNSTPPNSASPICGGSKSPNNSCRLPSLSIGEAKA